MFIRNWHWRWLLFFEYTAITLVTTIGLEEVIGNVFQSCNTRPFVGLKELSKSDLKFVITIVFTSHCISRLAFSDAVQSNENFS